METTPWPYPIVRLKPGKEALLSKGHPWVFSGALAGPPTAPLVRVADAAGRVLGVGTGSACNPLAVRLFRRTEEPLDRAFFQDRLERAVAGRRLLGLDGPEAGCRWVFGEGDLLPGLVVDRYGPALVLQVGTLGLEALRDLWWPVLLELGRAAGISIFVERS